MAAAVLVTAVGLSACGGGAAAVHVAANPQTRAQEAKAEKLVQKCAVKSNLLSRAGRQKFVACIAPPGRKVQVESCVQKKIASGHFLTRHQRQTLESEIAGCLLR